MKKSPLYHKFFYGLKKAYGAYDSDRREIISMNITGFLRSKYDQMKQNIRKLEEIRYDLFLRS